MTTQPPTNDGRTHNTTSDSSHQRAAELVEIPVLPPRTPSCYRPTTHFKQRLRERVPGRHHGPVPAKLIEDGRTQRRPWGAPVDLVEPGQPVAFTDKVDGKTYTVIAALRPAGFCSSDMTHDLLTVYTGEPPAEPTDAVGGEQAGGSQ